MANVLYANLGGKSMKESKMDAEVVFHFGEDSKKYIRKMQERRLQNVEDKILKKLDIATLKALSESIRKDMSEQEMEP